VVDLWPLNGRPGVPDWSSYETVVVGGPVYFGRWSRRLTGWLRRHAAALAAHPNWAAFVVSLSPRAAAMDYLKRGLPASLLGRPGHVACFGGSIVWKNLSWWEKWLLKRTRRIQTDVSNLDLGEIQGLAAWILGRSASAKPEQA
jgi:menaquinone-dependent protoporphyrinogen oxidase